MVLGLAAPGMALFMLYADAVLVVTWSLLCYAGAEALLPEMPLFEPTSHSPVCACLAGRCQEGYTHVRVG